MEINKSLDPADMVKLSSPKRNIFGSSNKSVIAPGNILKDKTE
jgi:hypothetical protein